MESPLEALRCLVVLVLSISVVLNAIAVRKLRAEVAAIVETRIVVEFEVGP